MNVCTIHILLILNKPLLSKSRLFVQFVFRWLSILWHLIMPADISHDISLNQCLMMSHDVSWCLVLSYVSWCLVLSYDVSWCLMVSHGISVCLMISQYGSGCLMVSQYVSWCIMVSHGVSWCLLITMTSHYVSRFIPHFIFSLVDLSVVSFKQLRCLQDSFIWWNAG